MPTKRPALGERPDGRLYSRITRRCVAILKHVRADRTFDLITRRVYVFAQDVNQATPDILPEIAAKQIGGFMVASGLQITFDPTLPCPLQAQAAVTVVA